MNYRTLGKTGYRVSEISFGAWAIGGTWGTVDDDQSLAALHAAVDSGVNFIDTADVYGDGRSERLIAQLLKERSEDIIVATKVGRRLDPHYSDGYTLDNLEAFVDRNLKNLDTDCLDLVQLHCPPTDAFYRPSVFEAMDTLKAKGKIRHYGVSVEKVEEAIKAIEFDGVATVQIIFNIFRQRPADLFFDLAAKKDVGILARVPLASGLLTGKMNRTSQFEDDDHRAFNREGAAFDKGETFAGVDYNTGLDAVDALRALIPEEMSMAQFALRWILMHDAVTCAIPGAKNTEQAIGNAQASGLSAFDDATMKAVNDIYVEQIRPQVHHLW